MNAAQVPCRPLFGLPSGLSCGSGRGSVPGFRTRTAETGAEMKTGQTMAIAGLIFNKKDASSPAPVQADAQGRYPAPVPGKWVEV